MTNTRLRPASAADGAASAGKRRLRTGLRISLTLIAVAAVAIWVPRALPSLDTFRSSFDSVSWNWVLAAALLQFGSIAMLIRQQRRLLRAFGTPVSLRRMAAITYSSTALAISLPAGAAISAGYSYRQFRTNGASARSAGLALVFSGVLSISSLVLIVGIGWAVASASGSGGVIGTHPVAAGLLAMLTIALTVIGKRLAERRRSTPLTVGTVRLDEFERHHRSVGRVARKLRELLQDMRTVGVGDWHLAMGTSAGKWLLDAGCLSACAQAVGVQLRLWEVIGVYLGVQIVRQIPLTPGGIGLVEVALITALMAAGVAAGPAAAATIVYRLFSAWLLIPVGYLILLSTRTAGPRQPPRLRRRRPERPNVEQITVRAVG